MEERSVDYYELNTNIDDGVTSALGQEDEEWNVLDMFKNSFSSSIDSNTRCEMWDDIDKPVYNSFQKHNFIASKNHAEYGSGNHQHLVNGKENIINSMFERCTPHQKELFDAFMEGSDHEFIENSLKVGTITHSEIESIGSIETIESIASKVFRNPYEPVHPSYENLPVLSNADGKSTHVSKFGDQFLDCDTTYNNTSVVEEISSYSQTTTHPSQCIAQEYPPVAKVAQDVPRILTEILKEVDEHMAIHKFIHVKWNERPDRKHEHTIAPRATTNAPFSFRNMVEWIALSVIRRQRCLKSPQKTNVGLIYHESLKSFSNSRIFNIAKIFQDEGFITTTHIPVSDLPRVENYGSNEYTIRMGLRSKNPDLIKFALPTKNELDRVTDLWNLSDSDFVLGTMAVLLEISTKKRLPRWVETPSPLDNFTPMTTALQLIQRILMILNLRNDFKRKLGVIYIMASEIYSTLPVPMEVDLLQALGTHTI